MTDTFKTVEIRIPIFSELFSALPEEERTPAVRPLLLAAYQTELQMLLAYAMAPTCKQPRIEMGQWREAASQHIAEFAVSDMARPWSGAEVNFHGQNTSQWCYAGAILVRNGEVSTHH